MRAFNEHVTELHGLPAFTFPQHEEEPALPGADAVAWRVECDYGQGNNNSEISHVYWERFTKLVELEKVRALICGIGLYEGDFANVERLLSVKDRLVNLEALFLADLEPEQMNVCSIVQSDLAPILDAFPQLRELSVRGSEDLEFPVTRHQNLRRLRFESAGLPAHVVRNVIAADLPALEHLDMGLGVDEWCDSTFFSGPVTTATVADLAPLLAGRRFPALRHLGLQNSEIQDEIAAAVASAPVVAQLESLDLSMGVLSDTGAEALLCGQPLTHLVSLNLRHHFLTDAMMQRVRDTLEPAGVKVDLSDQENEEDYGGRDIEAADWV